MRYFIKHEDREWIARPDAAAESPMSFELQETDEVETRRHQVRLLSESALLVDGHVVRVIAREQLHPGVFKLQLEAGDRPHSVIVETERARALAAGVWNR